MNPQHGYAVAMEGKCRLDKRADVETAGLDQVEFADFAPELDIHDGAAKVI